MSELKPVVPFVVGDTIRIRPLVMLFATNRRASSNCMVASEILLQFWRKVLSNKTVEAN
jgi:hypothetical protein